MRVHQELRWTRDIMFVRSTGRMQQMVAADDLSRRI